MADEPEVKLPDVQPGFQRLQINVPEGELMPEETSQEEVVAEETPQEEVPAEEPVQEEVPTEEPAKEEVPPTTEPEIKAEPADNKIPEQVKVFADFGAGIDVALQNDPAFRKAYLLHLKSTGVQLRPEHEALLAEKPPEAQKPSAPPEPQPLTKEEVLANARKLVLDGRDVEASDMLAEWHTGQAQRALRESIESLKAEHQKTKEELIAERNAGKERYAREKAKEQFRALADKYPELIQKWDDPKSMTGITSKDPEFLSTFYDIAKKHGAQADLEDCVELALVRMKRISKDTKRPAPKPAPKPVAPKMTGAAQPVKTAKWGEGKQQIVVLEQQKK